MEKRLTCHQCGKEFLFSEPEQAFYQEKGFKNAPKRCETCRMAESALLSAIKPKKEMYPAICADCGCKTELPFRPTGEKPVYCQACHIKRKKEEKN